MIILPEISKTRNFFVVGCWTTELSKANFSEYILYRCKHMIKSPKIRKIQDFSRAILEWELFLEMKFFKWVIYQNTLFHRKSAKFVIN